MRICIFSDIHGNQYAFEKFYELVNNQYDLYMFAGDVYGYYYGVENVITLLEEINPKYSVMGNHDDNYIRKKINLQKKEEFVKKYGSSYLIDSKKMDEWCRTQPYIVEKTIDNIHIAMVHGTLENFLNGREYPDTVKEYDSIYDKYDIVIQGHTHYFMKKKVRNTVVINPGSIGQSRNEMGSTYVILDTIDKNVEVCKFKWDKKLLYEEIRSRDPHYSKLIEVLERER